MFMLVTANDLSRIEMERLLDQGREVLSSGVKPRKWKPKECADCNDHGMRALNYFFSNHEERIACLLKKSDGPDLTDEEEDFLQERFTELRTILANCKAELSRYAGERRKRYKEIAGLLILYFTEMGFTN